MEDMDDYNPSEDDDIDIFNEVFEFALMEMAGIYAVHREQKGDSWQKMTPERLRNLFNHEIEEYTAANRDSTNEYNEILDIMNVGFMLLTRLATLGGG